VSDSQHKPEHVMPTLVAGAPSQPTSIVTPDTHSLRTTVQTVVFVRGYP
jgi:hypothetical protein